MSTFSSAPLRIAKRTSPPRVRFSASPSPPCAASTARRSAVPLTGASPVTSRSRSPICTPWMVSSSVSRGTRSRASTTTLPA